jgi:hypothetical protein
VLRCAAQREFEFGGEQGGLSALVIDVYLY